jgi:hypothetical protein
VRADRDRFGNHVLVQENSDPTDYRFPLAVVKEGWCKDVALSVRARPVSGEVDQGFGMIWRYKDPGNYYITRCNADEDNRTIYHTVAGRRRAFQNNPIKVASRREGRRVQGRRPRGALDEGRLVIEFDDFTIQER